MKKIDTLAIFSILIGTILEWYDFTLLGLMAPLISNLFFPSKSATVSLLATFSVFATGFIARPIGGVIFGHIGDKHGRRTALSSTIIWMTLPTTLIGCLPTFHSIGIWSPLILILLRLTQGMASSGEYPGAICYLVEIAPPTQRGLWGSMSIFGVVGGLLLGSLANLFMSSYLSTEQINSWGWRIPFLIGLPLGIIGWYLRYKVKESDIFLAAKLTTKTFTFPIQEVIKNNLSNVCKVILLFSLGPVSFYLGFMYINAYLVSSHNINLHTAMMNNTAGTFVLILFIPVFGYLSDKVNRKYILLTGTCCLLIFFYPIFKLFLSGPLSLLFGQILLAIFIAIFSGPLAAITSEIFSTFTRYSGVSIGLNIGASLFGGTCPLFATYLARSSGINTMPCIYPIIFGFLCLLVINFLPNNQSKLLDTI